MMENVEPKILYLHGKGLTATAISKRLNYPVDKVFYILGKEQKKLNTSRLAKETIDKILELHARRLTSYKIGKLLKISRQSAEYYILKAGLTPNPSQHNLVKLNRKRIKGLIEQGLTDGEVAKIIGCAVGTISKIRTQELGIKYGRALSYVDDKARKMLAQTVLNLKNKGFSRFELRELTGMTDPTIYRLLELGLDMQERGEVAKLNMNNSK